MALGVGEMSEFKGTPGPWRLDEKGVGNDHIIDGEYHVIEAGIGYCGPNSAGFGLHGFMSIADARLIAAAPKLLKALEGIMRVEARDRIMPVGAEWDAARAVIAEVTGEDQ